MKSIGVHSVKHFSTGFVFEQRIFLSGRNYFRCDVLIVSFKQRRFPIRSSFSKGIVNINSVSCIPVLV